MTPRTMLTASSIGRVTATSTSLTARPGDLGDDDDPREGHLGIDAAGHAEHRDDAEGGQQARGQDDQPEVRPGQGDEVDPAAGGAERFSVSRLRRSGSSSARPPGLGHRPCPPARLHRRPLGQVVTPLDDHRLALLQVGARDRHPAAVRRCRPRGGARPTCPSRTTFRTGPSPRSRIATAGTWSTSLRSSTVIDHPDRSARG